MDELLKEFLVESSENLDRLDRDFVTLEKNPTDKQLLASIFRAVHTIKGTCGFLNFSKLEKVTHVGENLLGKLRDGKLILNAEMTSALLALVDAIRKMLAQIEKSENDGDNTYPELIATLTSLQEGKSAPAPADPTPAESNAADQPAPVQAELAKTAPTPPVEKAPEPTTESSAASVTDSAIRVDVGLLDKLMNLVGELVLSRNQILQFISTQADSNLTGVSQRLNLITSELQEGIMKTRMQPIGNVWSKFPRVVRDLAASCGKKVRLEMQGKETELDKTLIEAIKDPLTHIVRNSVDHGVESPEKRKAAGKPEEGTLTLKAFHEGGQVNIEISDDGGGISPDKIKEKALAKSMITTEQAARMSERDILNLIFLPGFSTAEKVTNVSGRGVGMDVVRTNIERINGVIDIQSKPGMGTTLKIKIPLTLAIIPALVVTCGGDRYAIPQASLLELVRHSGEKVRKSIEMFQGAPVYRLRGRLLPLIYLRKELGLESENSEDSEDADLNIVVLQSGDRPFGLVVDEINDTQEIVVKPLGKLMKGVSVYAGATIMGDGHVALILDVLNIAQRAHLVGENRDRSLADQNALLSQNSKNLQALLLVRSRDNGLMAIPLSSVARLEEFALTSIENMSGQEVVQYRGKIMPLIRISEVLPERREEIRHLEAYKEETPSAAVHVVVYTPEDHGDGVRNAMGVVGIVVEKILDIVHESLNLQKAGCRAGILGSMVIQDRVTEVLDLEKAVQMAKPDFFAATDLPQSDIKEISQESRLHS